MSLSDRPYPSSAVSRRPEEESRGCRRIALAQMASIGQVAMLITDSSADAHELDQLRSAGVEVVLADES